jgi:hypothetical protein
MENYEENIVRIAGRRAEIRTRGVPSKSRVCKQQNHKVQLRNLNPTQMTGSLSTSAPMCKTRPGWRETYGRPEWKTYIFSKYVLCCSAYEHISMVTLLQILIYRFTINNFLCSLVVKVPGYRARYPGSDSRRF